MTLTSSRPLVAIIANPAVRPDDFDAAPGLAPSGGGGGSGGSSGFLSRDHIIQATEECFTEAGYDGTTIRAIAGRLGCAVGSIYRYFGDKRALLLAVAGRMFEPIMEALNPRTGSATFEQSLAAYIDAAVAQPQRYRLLMWLSGGDQPGGEALLPEALDGVISGWARLLGSRDRAETIWSAVHGMLTLGREPGQIMDVIRTMLDTDADAEARGLPPAAASPPDAGYTAASLEADDVTLL